MKKKPLTKALLSRLASRSAIGNVKPSQIIRDRRRDLRDDLAKQELEREVRERNDHG